MSVFRERLKELLDDSNLTVQELAKKSGIPQSSLSHWTRYDVTPKTKSMIQLAQYFQCPVDYFLGKTDEIKTRFSKTPIVFSERLKALIKAKNITAYRACRQLHIETDIMSVWQNKGTYPSYDNLLMLTDYFDCSADYLLGLSDYM